MSTPSIRADAPVKSDPWRKSKAPARTRGSPLWSNAFWKSLTERPFGGVRAPFTGEVLERICQENLRLYGHR